MDFDKDDGLKWKKLFELWKLLKMGIRDYKAREPNIPEGLSEVAFCLFSGSKRFLKLTSNKSVATSFDTFNINNNRAEQIKASSINKDLTSFGPKSKWDDLYFLDFFNQGKLDGTFNLYKIPNNLIKKVSLNKKQKFTDQQEEKRRPRFSILGKIIIPYKINAVKTNIKVW